jgi:[acyl-carrier-protein] S-malonyltransferase
VALASSLDCCGRGSDVTGVDVGYILLDAHGDEVVRTDNAQLATFTLSLVSWKAWRESHDAPDFFAGHSLGELSALVASGALSLHDGALVVATRSRAMREACLAQPGSMVALMGGDESARERLDGLADLWLANDNGPGQVVAAGTRAAVNELLASYRDLGWRRASELTVDGAFHTPLMTSAVEPLSQALASANFSVPTGHMFSNVDAAAHSSPADWPDLCLRQLTSPVQFHSLISSLPADVSEAVEFAPAGVLLGLVKRIRDFVRLSGVETPESL